MKWLKQLKLVSLRARAPWIGVCLALAIGIFWGGGCGSLVLCLTPKTLSELTEESLEGAYVADSIPYLHVLYAREEAFRRDEPAGEVLGLYYAIDFGEGRYMGLCVRGGDMSRAERVMSACQVYRYGELPREKIPVLPVSGTVKAMEGGELDCFMALAGENEALAAAMLPYYIDAGRIGPRTVTAQALLALTALAFLLLALFPAVRALSGAYQRQVVAVLSQSWSRSIAAERAGQFYDRTQPVCGVRMGPEHVFFQQGPKSILLRPCSTPSLWTMSGPVSSWRPCPRRFQAPPLAIPRRPSASIGRTAAPSPPAGRRFGPRRREAVRYSAAPGPHRY